MSEVKAVRTALVQASQPQAALPGRGICLRRNHKSGKTMGKLSGSVSAASVAVVLAALVTGCTTQADFEAMSVE